MKNLKTNWLLKHTLTVFSCVLIVVLGIVFLSHADPVTTTIGENIATNDLSVAGNVTSGTWQGTAVATQFGGTGADWSAVAQGNLPYFSAEGALSNLAPGTAGQFLQSGGTGADPVWANVTRSATFVVAANDSSALSKQQADYVCDGTDDQVEIQAAIDAAGDLGGGKVVLLEGNYSVDPVSNVYSTYWSCINLRTNVHLIGAGIPEIRIESPASHPFLIVYGNAVEDVTIEGIKFDGAASGAANVAIFLVGAFKNLHVESNHFENCSKGIHFDNSGVSSGFIVSNYFFNMLDWSISVHNAPKRCIVSNNMIYSGLNGIFLDSVNRSIVTGNIVTVTGYALYLYDDVNNAVMTNNYLSGSTGGIAFEHNDEKPDSDNNIFHSNYISGNITVYGTQNSFQSNMLNNPIIIDNGTNTIIQNNIGYTTESSGTATLVNGTTSIVVTHGLDATPSAGDITITPIEAWGAMTEFYIDTYTSTQFTIHADQDPGQDVDFAWKAIVL